jgi:uracil phosphoribosyltransferase
VLGRAAARRLRKDRTVAERETLYDRIHYRAPEIEHRYGPRVHILSDPALLTLLARLCAKETVQPAFNRLVATIYFEILRTVANLEFPRKRVSIPTRMAEHTPHGIFHGEIIDPDTRAVTVNIARAGTLPSQICFDTLNQLLHPAGVRQDHLLMARTVDEAERVTGAAVGGLKIGGSVDGRIVLFPDPMGATGSSLSKAISVYKQQVEGEAVKYIAVHLIVTPEYLRRLTTLHPELLIYAVRLDRGLSPPHVFDTVPGTLWDEERGLNEHQYIVPGGGGFGELMNNALV